MLHIVRADEDASSLIGKLLKAPHLEIFSSSHRSVNRVQPLTYLEIASVGMNFECSTPRFSSLVRQIAIRAASSPSAARRAREWVWREAREETKARHSAARATGSAGAR